MFLLLKLYLAHLIGDFVLQTEGLYRLKLKTWIGHLVHVLIHAFISLLIVLPYLGEPFIWFFVFTISTIHLFQDMLKYRLTQRKSQIFPLFMADQISHFLFVSSILLFPISRKQLAFPLPAINFFYAENDWTFYFITLIFLSTAGGYLLQNFRLSYLPDTRPDHFITPREMIHGTIERLVIGHIFLLSPDPLFFLLAPAAGIPRFFIPWLRNKTDFVLSLAYAAFVGLLFRSWFFH